jgi:hypothetical protein
MSLDELDAVSAAGNVELRERPQLHNTPKNPL